MVFSSLKTKERYGFETVRRWSRQDLLDSHASAPGVEK